MRGRLIANPVFFNLKWMLWLSMQVICRMAVTPRYYLPFHMVQWRQFDRYRSLLLLTQCILIGKFKAEQAYIV